MCQWDKDSCADAGFLKIDLLGLGMLSAVEECVDLIARTRGEQIDLSRIPLDDRGGVRGDPAGRHRRLLPDREPRADADDPPHTAGEPRRHHDPGRPRPARADPGQGGAPVHRAAPAPARGSELRAAGRPSALREPLRETLGVVVFQDQVLDVAIHPAGFTVGEAEGLRRAMSRKRSHAALEAYRERFVAGAIGKGVEEPPRTPSTTSSSLLRLRLPEVALGRVRAARVPVGVAAPSLRSRVPRGAAERAADGLLPAGDARTRRAAARHRDASAGDQPQRCRLRLEDSAVRVGLKYVQGVGQDDAEAIVAERGRTRPCASSPSAAACATSWPRSSKQAPATASA